MKYLTDGKANNQKYKTGRYIDPEIAELTGEGSNQAITQEKPHPHRKEYEVWDKLPSSSFTDEKTYYNLPMLKEPVWEWSVPTYLYIGGAAGTSAVLASAAQILLPRSLSRLIRKCRYLSLAGLGIGSGLLIYDLGRKDRFLNMLRVFRPTSPMNMGSWILALTGFFTTGSLLYNGRNRFLRKISDVLGIGSGISGVMLAGYTGVLLGYSAVPIWKESGKILPLLFIASGMSGAASTLQLMNLTKKEDDVVLRFSIAGIVSELAAAQALEREIKNYSYVKRSLHEGVPGVLWKAGRILSAAALVLSLIPGKSKLKKTASAILEASGAMSIRFAVFKAGQASARNPRAVFELQREMERESGGERIDADLIDIT